MISPQLSSISEQEKQPRSQKTASPGSLLSQWWTLGAILADGRATGRHAKVAWVIIDRYMQARGNGRASLRYIERATGISRHTVIKACRELVEWGFLEHRPGIGTRPTEYTPKWLVVHPSTPLSSGEPLCTTSGEPLCTATDDSGEPLCTESYLPSPADKPADELSRTSSTPAPPTAPLSDGLSATDAESARDPESSFERFWRAYPRKFQKPKARAAWDRIVPDDDLAERIIVAASNWAAHYEAEGTAKKWIPTPVNWLSGERYDEDLPAVYENAKEAAIARKATVAKSKPAEKPAPANDNAPTTKWVGDVSGLVPPGLHAFSIIDAKLETDAEGNAKLTVTMDIDCGSLVHGGVTHEFWTEHRDDSLQRKGGKHLHDLLNAIGRNDIENAAELIGGEGKAKVGGDGSIAYQNVFLMEVS